MTGKGAGAMVRWAKVGAVAMTTTALAVSPVATASASLHKTSLCAAYRSDLAKQVKSSNAMEKDLASGSWAKNKSALLSNFNAEASAQKQFTGYLRGASAKVKAAAAVALELDDTFRTVILRAKSRAQFQAGITAAESTPKVTAAISVLDRYTTMHCGSTTPTA